MKGQTLEFNNDFEAQEYVLKLHNYRCVGIDKPCFKYTTTVHEILPRSRGKLSLDVHNRVPLCCGCHEKVHGYLGVSEWVIKSLQERRRVVLTSLGKEDAI